MNRRKHIKRVLLWILRAGAVLFLLTALLALLTGGIQCSLFGQSVRVSSPEKYLWRALLCSVGVFVLDRRLRESIRWKPPRQLRFLPVLILLAFLTWGFLLTQPYGRDQAGYLYIGNEMAHGAKPYSDWWENKPPLLLYSYAAMTWWWGTSAVTVNLTDLLLALCTATLLYILLARAADRPTAALGVLLYSVYAHPMLLSKRSFYLAAQPESFIQPLSVLAMLLGYLAVQRRRIWPLPLAGLCLAAAFFYKYNAALYAGPLLIGVAANLVAHRRDPSARGLFWKSLLGLFLGGLAGVLMVIGFCKAQGILPEMLYATWTFNREVYLASSPYSVPALVAKALKEIFQRVLTNPQGMLWLGALYFVVRVGRVQRRPALLLLASWPVCSLLAILSNRMLFSNHFPQIYPALCAATALGLRELLDGESALSGSLRPRRTFIVTTLVAASMLFLIAVVAASPHTYFFLGRTSWPDYLSQVQGYGKNHGQSVRANDEVARYLKEHTEAGQAIFIWGFEPMVYLMADRPCGARYLYADHVILRELAGEAPETLYPPLIAQWEENRIEYLLLVEHDRSANLPRETKEHFLDTPLLREYLESRFAFEVQIEDFSLYRRVPEAEKTRQNNDPE